MDPERSVRVRIAGDRGFLTIKGRSSGAARDEFEYPFPWPMRANCSPGFAFSR